MITTPISPALIRGSADLEQTDRGLRPHRLPAWVMAQFPDPQLMSAEAQPSGIRIVFRTEATRLELVSHPARVAYRGANRPRGRIDVVVDNTLFARDPLGGGDLTEIDLQTGAATSLPGPSHSTIVEDMPAGDKQVELWLPHNEGLELVTLRSDAPLHATTESGPLWVHHGSSISHGSNAIAPTETWTAIAARAGGVQLQNLGFGGSAMVDPFLARVIRDAPADVISIKLGINVVNADAMRLRAFVPAVHGFIDTIRDRHPTTPLVVISPIFCAIHEDTPGPAAIEPGSLGTDQVRFIATGQTGAESQGRLTLRVIRRELQALVERRSADPNLFYLDGTELYSAADATRLPLPDGLHPDADTHRLIGERFAEYAFGRSGARVLFAQ